MTDSAPLRLFFALWPDAQTAQQLIAVQDALKPAVDGRWLPHGQLHVTLVFLGNVSASRLPVLKALAAEVTASPITLNLDGLSVWRRSQVLCLTPSATPPALSELTERLASALATASFRLETRRYRPHLTLARQARCASQPLRMAEPLRLRAEAFCLVESRIGPAGPAYVRLAAWPLEQPPLTPDEN